MKIVTIGVYGFSESAFFDALIRAKVDLFCDIRARRGVRGPQYTFANSANLQKRLHKLGIRYIHLKELAPSGEVRQLQDEIDKQQLVPKRQRATLSDSFIRPTHQKNCPHSIPPIL
jgi:uncharacterized protein (DUF488 family)